jgi:WD40 repeat protein
MKASQPLDGSELSVDSIREIDVICRRFEADWRAGGRPPLDSYLAEVSDHVRPALLAELEALERELLRSEETVTRGEPVAAAEAPTIAPAEPPTHPTPGEARLSSHEDATVAPIDQATLEHGPSSGSQAADASPARIRYFGDYEILREIARGGMGVVFQARQVSLNRPVALKMILAGQLANDTDVKRFYTEAEAAANLDHPGIVPIYEVGQHEGQHYFSMGYVEGQSLSHRLADGPLPPRKAAELMVKVAAAIEFAHQRGVIHRDLKPANILLDKNGNPRVTDFGLAKKLQADSGLTGSGQIMGTPSYMPPEQAGGERGEIGPAADVYALGATLYALITGRPPFQAATAMDTVIQVIGEDPVPPRRLNASVPRDLETICLKCLEKEPRRRYGSAGALADDINRFMSGEPISARPVGVVERGMKWVRRRPVIAALLGLVLVVSAMGSAGVLWQWRQAVLARRNVELERERVAALAELTQRRLNAARMNLIQHHWEEFNGELMRRGLEEQIPPGSTVVDRRGFEWFYWERRLSSGHRIIKASSKPVRSVAFSADGRRIAAAGEEGIVWAWDAGDARNLLSIRGHAGPIWWVAFSPDGRHLASSGDDGTLRLWKADGGGPLHVLKGSGKSIRRFEFSPDGRRIAAITGIGAAGGIKAWEIVSGKEIPTLDFRQPLSPFSSLAFSPDGRRLTLLDATYGLSNSGERTGTLRLWDAGSAKPRLLLRSNVQLPSVVVYVRPSVVASSPDGKRFVSGGGNGSVKVWDSAAGRETRTIKLHTGAVSNLAFSPDGRRLASTGGEGTAAVFDPETDRDPLVLRGHIGPINSVSFSPDGRTLATAGVDGTVRLWDAEAGQEPPTLKCPPESVLALAFSADGRRLAYGDPGNVTIWDLTIADAKPVTELRTGLARVALGPDLHLGAFADRDGTVRVFEIESGQCTRTLGGHKGPVLSLAFSPDGHRLASGGWDRTVKIWDLDAGREILTFNGHTRPVGVLTFHPDGKSLASAGEDRALKVWEIASGRVIGSLEWPGGSDLGLTFSPDGLRVAVASRDGTVAVREVSSGQQVLTLRGHSSPVRRVTFSPDGRRIASAGHDSTVRLWDATTGEQTLTLKGHSGDVLAVAFEPSGHRLASAGADGEVRLWDARPLDADPAKPGPTPR